MLLLLLGLFLVLCGGCMVFRTAPRSVNRHIAASMLVVGIPTLWLAIETLSK